MATFGEKGRLSDLLFEQSVQQATVVIYNYLFISQRC